MQKDNKAIKILMFLIFIALPNAGGVLKNNSFVIDETTKDTFALINRNTNLHICIDDSIGKYQNVDFYAYVKNESKLLGKVTFNSSLKDTFLVHITDTIVIYQDETCRNAIGKVWNNVGVHSKSLAHTDENIRLGFFGAIEGSNFTTRKPWQHIFSNSGIKNAFVLTRDTISTLLEKSGYFSIETWNDSEYTFDYYIEGCDPLGTIKAILAYSKYFLVAYWTEEKLKGQEFEIVNGKYLYYSEKENQIKNIIRNRICNECSGGIGSPLIEGCNKKCKKRK